MYAKRSTLFDTDVAQRYLSVRSQTTKLIQSLTHEDMQAQSMPDASPIKWHLAHTTWFFETFVLAKYVPRYSLFHHQYSILFNSYYETVGARVNRDQRGLLTRPPMQEVLNFRRYVDEHMMMFFDNSDCNERSVAVVELGLHHEMQHQELMLTDLLHLFSVNPLLPEVFPRQGWVENRSSPKINWVKREAEMASVGADNSQFSYDCERPRHQTYLPSHILGDRLVSNQEWLAFMEDGAYQNTMLWLADGWAECQHQKWHAPLYWQQDSHGEWSQFGLDGLHRIDMGAPVCHISYYEADAFARWSGKRLPREHELEYAAKDQPILGNFVESEQWRPVSDRADSEQACAQLYGDVWEWTQSAYSPYPNFAPEHGGLGEYNGKFMSNQFVLKGGSCATPRQQMRPSYRNFFYPKQRWQFTGLRLAADI